MGFPTYALRMLVMLQVLLVASASFMDVTGTSREVITKGDDLTADCIEACWISSAIHYDCDVSEVARDFGATQACMCPMSSAIHHFGDCISNLCGPEGDRHRLSGEMDCDIYRDIFPGVNELRAKQASARSADLVEAYSNEAKTILSNFEKLQDRDAAAAADWDAQVDRAVSDISAKLEHTDATFVKNAFEKRDAQTPRQRLPPGFGFCGALGSSCAKNAAGSNETNATSSAAAPDYTITDKRARLPPKFGFCGAPGASCANAHGKVDANAADIMVTTSVSAPPATTFTTSTYVAAVKRDAEPQIAQLLSEIGHTLKPTTKPTPVAPAGEKPRPTKKHGDLPAGFGFCGARGASCSVNADAARNVTQGNATHGNATGTN